MTRLRRAPGIELRGSSSGLTLVLPDSQQELEAEMLQDDIFLDVVLTCESWTPMTEVARRIQEKVKLSAKGAQQIIDTLVASGVLCADDDPGARHSVEVEERWSARGWDAPFRYLLSTRHGKGAEAPATAAPSRELAHSIEKRFSHSRAFDLPVEKHKAYPDRAFLSLPAPVAPEQGGELALPSLAWLMSLAFGDQEPQRSRYVGMPLGKATPSWGNVHPLEVYPLLLRVTGVEPGLYHFNTQRHGLELLRPNAHLDAPLLPHGQTPAAVFFFTALFERSLAHFRDSDAYRAVFQDLGHVLQLTALLATELGRECTHVRGTADARLDALLGLEGPLESVVAFSMLD